MGQAARKDEEIEISPEMIEAGKDAIYQHRGRLGDDGWVEENVDETVKDVFLAMSAAQK
jgi:hypothetical protein